MHADTGVLIIAGKPGDPTGNDSNEDENEDFEVKSSPRFMQYVKEKKFEIKDFPQAGLNGNVVVVPAKKETMVSQRPRPCIVTDTYSSAPLHVTITFSMNTMHASTPTLSNLIVQPVLIVTESAKRGLIAFPINCTWPSIV